MNLPLDLKYYRAPRWYDSYIQWLKDNWVWIGIVGYMSLAWVR